MGMPPHQLRPGGRGDAWPLSTACPQAPRRACSTSGEGPAGDEGARGGVCSGVFRCKRHLCGQVALRASFISCYSLVQNQALLETPQFGSLVQFESLTPNRHRLSIGPACPWTSSPAACGRDLSASDQYSARLRWAGLARRRRHQTNGPLGRDATLLTPLAVKVSWFVQMMAYDLLESKRAPSLRGGRERHILADRHTPGRQ